MKAVILAGGRGTRLKPYTTVFPKPLMPIKDRPILDIIIQKLKSSDIDEIILAVGHLSELIMAFFGDGTKFGVKIKYSREDKPLGTIGGLGFIKDELNEPFLMMNGDVLTTLNFHDLIGYHKNNDAIATIALNKRDVHIDFGVVELDDNNNISKFIEKPNIDYLVSMGIYVFSPKVLEFIKPNEYLDFPDLINDLISKKEKVNGYIYDGYWLDIGRPEDYERANNDIDKICDMID